MKQKQQLLISILIVLVIIVSVVGGTYAYFTWITASDQQTSIEFAVDQNVLGGALNAKIEGNANITTTDAIFKPTVCTNSTNAIIKKIPINYLNSTIQPATVTATLKVTKFNLRSELYIPDAEELKNLKYALTTSQIDCTKDVQQSGNFSGMSVRQGNGNNISYTILNQTISVPANMTEPMTQTYYLWIWLDSEYSHQNAGDVNSDPLQGFSMTAEWSGKITQNNT